MKLNFESIHNYLLSLSPFMFSLRVLNLIRYMNILIEKGERK